MATNNNVCCPETETPEMTNIKQFYDNNINRLFE